MMQIKTAFQQPDKNLYRLSDGKLIEKSELEKLIALMPGFEWIVVEYQKVKIKPKNEHGKTND